MRENLRLQQKIVRSMLRLDERTANMKKPEKFSYKRYAGDAYMKLLELCIEANAERGSKKPLQSRMDMELDKLRVFVDTAVAPEIKLISPGLHEVWSKELNEIGALLGTWIKTTK